MTSKELKRIIIQGEDSFHQFKTDFSNAAGLAAEMAAFSNSAGGFIYIGIADDGAVKGLTKERIRHLNQLISNAASQSIHPPLNPITEIINIDNKLVLSVRIQDGILKPYMDNNGVIWVKSGADKRRVTSREEVQRIFQSANLIHADEMPVKGTSINNVDMEYFRSFFIKAYNEEFAIQQNEMETLLQNMNLSVEGELNVAGMLLIGKEPNGKLPVYSIKAVCYPGSDIHASEYIDSEDITGKLETQYKDAISFISRNIRHIQKGQNVNSTGMLEIPKITLEEIIANAIIHRDYFISAHIRIFIFSDRVEIISPGHLPNSLTIDKIKNGNSVIRNSIIASFMSKILPFRGLGNGIRRAIKEHPGIDFEDDREGNQFIVTVWRKSSNKTDQKNRPEKPTRKTDQKNDNKKVGINRIYDWSSTRQAARLKETDQKKPTGKTDRKKSEFEGKFIELIISNPYITRKEMSRIFEMNDSAVKRRIENLVRSGLIRRVGPDKGGHWEVVKNK